MNSKGVILTAAKADVTICDVFGYIPTGLIPVNGKPIIYYIIKQFIESGIDDIYISVDYKKNKIKSIINLYFDKSAKFNYVKTDKNKKPGNSLLKILKNFESGSAVINLADTYIKNLPLDSIDNTLVVSDDYSDGRRWASVKLDKSENIVEFINKKKLTDNHFVLTGVYVFKDVSVFKKYKPKNENIEIIDLCKFYMDNSGELNIIKTDEWMDFGHIDRYQFSKKRLIQSREFNNLEFDDFFGTISKKSDNQKKLKNEISWYLNLPSQLKIVSPRIIDYSLDSKPYIVSEYYSYPPLSEIWLFSELSIEIFKSIINKLFKVLKLFQTHQKDVKFINYEELYINKTISRVSDIANADLIKLMSYDVVNINGHPQKNWKKLKEDVFSQIPKLYNTEHNCLIHGDFCFSNILYDIRSGIFKIIDPRGMWGGSVYGDIKYDFAKLRHSISGGYDYISNDLYKLSFDVENKNINYSINQYYNNDIVEYFDSKLELEFNLSHIKLIEGLLFLSMIPLHNENKNRQIVFYAKSLEILNNLDYG